MLLGGHERHAHKHAQILIHQISSGSFWGKFEELKDEIQTCKKLMKTLKKIYTSNTNIPEDVYNNIMKRDVYLSADKCLEYDIVTKLL
jgi:ATP-dependent protease ClpP protease subunit